VSSGPLPPLYVRARDPISPAEAGRIGAQKRWGERRVVRLDTLPQPVADAVRALLHGAEQAARNASTGGTK
jgi:hypothetical protein